MTALDAQAYLSSFIDFEAKLHVLSIRHFQSSSRKGGSGFNLARVERVLDRLGSPQKRIPVIHVAGSKGKGSTSAMIATVLSQAGYRVGLYTSPHMYDVRERIRILSLKNQKARTMFSGMISPTAFKQLIVTLKPILESARHDPVLGALTYFEVLTILAFCYFDRQAVDLAVLETGLGGRLDATTVCRPLVCVLTPISLEHTHLLGSTVKKIAKEKAAIIKRWGNDVVPDVIVAPQPREARAVIVHRCRRMNIKPVEVGRDIVVEELRQTPQGQKFKMGDGSRSLFYHIPFQGLHQVENAATVATVMHVLNKRGYTIREKDIQRGFLKTSWPLRFEILSRKPIIVLDAAHNPDSCKRLVKTLKEVYPGKSVILIFGSSQDKDIAGMSRILNRMARKILLVRADHPRAKVWGKDDIIKYFASKETFLFEHISEACRAAPRLASANDLIVVTGSLFAAAQARRCFMKGKK